MAKSLVVLEAKKNHVLSQIQTVFDMIKDVEDESVRTQFLVRAKSANKLRNEFSLFLDNYNELKLEQDSNFQPTYTDLEKVDELVDYINANVPVLENTAKTSSSTDTSFSDSRLLSTSHVRLPKLSLKTFNGDPATWTSFVNLYDTSVHHNPSLSAVMKFQYLLSSLSSEPLSLIQSLNITDANYGIAYDLLRKRYHNPRRLKSIHLNSILDLPSVSESLRTFINLFHEHTQAIKALGCDLMTEDNPLLSALLLRKLNEDLRRKLEAFRSNKECEPHSLPSPQEIVEFLNEECSMTEDANIHNSPHSSKTPVYVPPHSRNKAIPPKKGIFRPSDVTMVTAQAASTKVTPRACFACNQTDHKIYSCHVFRSQSPQERHQLVKKQNRCVSCLGSHTLRDCQSVSTCQTCNKRHHSLLHFPSYTCNPNNKTPHSNVTHGVSNEHQANNLSQNNENGTSVILTSQSPQCSASCSTVLLGTLLLKLRTPEGKCHVFRALLDSGSMSDLITERAAQLLGARRSKCHVTLSGLSQNTTKTKGQINLTIENLSGLMIASHHPMIILDNLTVDLPRVPLTPEVYAKTQRYILADPTFHLPGRIDVVLGGSLFPKILTQEHFSLGQHMPHVIGSLFGYVVMGTAPCASLSPNTKDTLASSILNVSLHCASDIDLHSSLQRFWHQEEPPVYKKKTEEEELCDAHFIATHSRTEEGRYVVRLPFKENHPPLGSSQLNAERRLYSIERKFASQPHFSQLYHDFIEEYRALDHMVKCPNFDRTTPHYFLPHHGVLKENSTTTKLRTVFDASCKTSTGFSLNDTLLTGRKLQTNICDVLLHFRSHNYVFACDIRQMYRQIRVHPDDRSFQLILWRDNLDHDLEVYQLNTVTYGMNTSPYLAIRTLHQLADDDGDNFPAAAQVLRTQTYVDDIISGANTEDEALELQEQLIHLLRQGGFELRKWVSNSSRLLQSLPEGHLESPVFLQESQSPHFSILGLHWSPVTDCFTYAFNLPFDPRPTKRSVLSLVAKIYDPCGFLAPCIMLAKCFMQLLWTTGLTWDDPLPTDHAEKWLAFVTDAQHLTRISIPRPFQFSSSCAIELHGFSDASESGYSAIVYFRCQLSTAEVIIRPVMAKTRVAPLKRITLPRLELCGAHLLAQLVVHCQSIFKNTITLHNTYLWCDSSVVLTWLRTPPYRLKTYVANRVSQTQECVPLDSWRHVSSGDNPADCASRGIYASHLVNHPLWWTGPSWLQLPHQEWPNSQFVPVDLSSSDDIKRTPLAVFITAQHEEWDILFAFSSWTKLLHIVALTLRFINNCLAHQERRTGPLSVSEIIAARLKIFGLVQRHAFSDELTALKRKQDCSSKLQRLKPYIDSDGLLRVGGRLSLTALPLDARHPVLLPKTHHVVNLLIDHYHATHLHAGPQLTQALLAKAVWIFSARSIIRSRIFKCIKCFKNKPRNSTPLMGDLPLARVTPTRPFLTVGIDYAGPFMAKVFNLRSVKHVKVYLCVFVCMATKAVHIEVVTDLTADGFIAALTRFVSRRGLSADIYCDCGTNFVGADVALRRIINENTSPPAQEKIQNFAVHRGIRFHFNPPAAPHQGGLWEAAVKSAKYHLKRVMGNTVLSFTEFITLITQVEAMLNSRPLTPLSSDPADLSALTPGHFLIGTPLASVPEPNLMDTPSNRLKHYQLIQSFHQHIWKRWSLEYLHMLQQRSKWSKTHPNVQVGDLVLLHTPSAPLDWPLARITAVHPGRDGVVRVVELKTASGHLTRPVVKVFPLPTN